MKKFGPLSLDMLVACQILHHRVHNNGAKSEFGLLVRELDGLVSKSAVSPILNNLLKWGIVNTEFGETSAGRAGRLYYISNEAESFVKSTYDLFWDDIEEQRNN